MKKLLALIACGLMLNSPSHYYSKLLKVTDIEAGRYTWVTMIDCNGEEWTWTLDSPEDFEVGDYYSAVMDDCGTKQIEDDEIVSLHYERVDLLEGE